ncbi:MAG: ABC transporter [Pseudomonadota bacterium]
MKYQLVVQLTEDIGLDKLISIEDLLIQKLSFNTEVDGHDIGMGEMNIFIYTDSPEELLQEILSILKYDPYIYAVIKVAFREVDKDPYTCLWPKDLKNFSVI